MGYTALVKTHGPAAKETTSIQAQLRLRGLQLVDIPTDGNCLFRAVGHQLKLHNRPEGDFSTSNCGCYPSYTWKNTQMIMLVFYLRERTTCKLILEKCVKMVFGAGI